MAELYVAEIAAGGEKVAISLPRKPTTVGDLRVMIHAGPQNDIIFQGGKKLKSEDPVPFTGEGRVKVRIFGTWRQQPDRPSAAPLMTMEKAGPSPASEPEEQRIKTSHDQVPCHDAQGLPSKETSPEIPYALIKGLSSLPETRISLSGITTYAELKQAFSKDASCQTRDWRCIKFLGKGGKSPLDSDSIPSGVSEIVLRALRTERGHTEVDKKREVGGIASRITEADKMINQIKGRLIDSETAIIETARLRDELLDAIAWLSREGKCNDTLIAKARACLERL